MQYNISSYARLYAILIDAIYTCLCRCVYIYISKCIYIYIYTNILYIYGVDIKQRQKNYISYMIFFVNSSIHM